LRARNPELDELELELGVVAGLNPELAEPTLIVVPGVRVVRAISVSEIDGHCAALETRA
jgi:hypothetical protein